MAKVLDAMTDRLRESGVKLTAPRRVLLEGIIAIGDRHFDAEDICGKVQPSGISRATVYRTLPILLDCGIIQRAYRRRDRQYYEMGHGVQHHDHLLCIECGRAIEFLDDRIEEIQDKACRKKRFRPLDHRLIIRGLCSSCAKKVKTGHQGKAS